MERFSAFRKEFGITMEYQNSNKHCNNRSPRKTNEAFYQKAAGIVLCLLIFIASIQFLSLIRTGKETFNPEKEISKNSEWYSLADVGQNRMDFTPFDADEKTLSVNIAARNAVVINADTNVLLYQKGSTEKIAPASTAKMVTALTALDYCSPDDELTVGTEIEMIHADSSSACLMQGDILTIRQLLIALMLPSGNDAAYVFAVNTGKIIAGDNSLSNAQYIDLFMDKVNEKAKVLGAKNSNFVVPDGYDADGQYTTANDLAVIAKACLDNPCISEIAASYSSREKWPDGREVTYRSTNELLNPDSQYYRPEVIGLKTGTSSLGGGCVVSAAVINGNTYICVVMGSAENARFQDSIKIYDAIEAQYDIKE